MLVGGILEWVLGNTFPSVVFCTFGGFYLSYGGTLNPSFAAISSYAPADATSGTEGLATTGFNASLGKIEILVWNLDSVTDLNRFLVPVYGASHMGLLGVLVANERRLRDYLPFTWLGLLLVDWCFLGFRLRLHWKRGGRQATFGGM